MVLRNNIHSFHYFFYCGVLGRIRVDNRLVCKIGQCALERVHEQTPGL